jgi:hypothetical protein
MLDQLAEQPFGTSRRDLSTGVLFAASKWGVLRIGSAILTQRVPIYIELSHPSLDLVVEKNPEPP